MGKILLTGFLLSGLGVGHSLACHARALPPRSRWPPGCAARPPRAPRPAPRTACRAEGSACASGGLSGDEKTIQTCQKQRSPMENAKIWFSRELRKHDPISSHPAESIVCRAPRRPPAIVGCAREPSPFCAPEDANLADCGRWCSWGQRKGKCSKGSFTSVRALLVKFPSAQWQLIF